jgi:hypothetical protein
MLDLLRHDLLFTGSRTEIVTMAFFTTLCQAYDYHDMGKYNESQGFAWIQGIREALVAGECDSLGTMVNIRENH